MLFTQARAFGAKADPIPEGKRQNANPGYYNIRFQPSSSVDNNYFENNGTIRGAHGFEPHKTNRDPTKFTYSNNLFANDYWEWKMRSSDYFYQIFSRLHRSNDGWTRTLAAYTSFSFLMASQALVWKVHFFVGSLSLAARIRDKGAEPTVDEINLLDTIFANDKLNTLFTPDTYHVIDYDQEWDEGRENPLFPEYQQVTARFFNSDCNTTTGSYTIGDVESGAIMTLNFKTMPYANNKYNFTEPFLVYDLVANVTHDGKVFSEVITRAEDTLKTKQVFVPWH